MRILAPHSLLPLCATVIALFAPAGLWEEVQATQERMIARFPKFISNLAVLSETTILGTAYREGFTRDVALITLATGEIRSLASGQCASPSPDRARAAWIPGPGSRGDVWLLDLQALTRRRLTEGLGANCVVWSHDGKRLAALNVSQTSRFGDDILFVAADSGRTEQTVNADDLYFSDPAWYPDGQRLAFGVSRLVSSTWVDNRLEGWFDLRQRRRFQILTLGGDAPPGGLAISPDGRTLLYVLRGPVRGQIFAYDGAVVKPIAGGHSPLWMPDGRSILFARRYDCTGVLCAGDELYTLRF